MNSSSASASDPAPAAPSPVTLRIFADDVSLAEILSAESPPPKKTRRPESSRSLGVYDADGDILDQYLHEVSRTPLLTVSQEIAVAKGRSYPARRPVATISTVMPSDCRVDRYPGHPSLRSGWSGGEGDRTPDLVNAIHALSQLSYAPMYFSRPASLAGLSQGVVKLPVATRRVKQKDGFCRASFAIRTTRIW